MSNSTEREEDKSPEEPPAFQQSEVQDLGRTMIHKKVSRSGSSSGRIYLPPTG